MGIMQQGGTAGSGWGLGTSPYATSPAPADANAQVENREGNDTMGNTGTMDYESLYTPEEFAHGFSSDNQLQGQLDLSAPAQRIEEIRSAPESQEALTEYANIIGTFAEGEETAINREQVPLEYQELVKQYFDRLQQDATGAGSSESGDSGGDGEASGENEGGEG